MKKYLLLGLTPLLLCSFTLAHDVSFTCNGVSNSDGEISCSPTTLDYSDFDEEQFPSFDGSQITVSNIRNLVDNYGTILLRLDCVGDNEGESESIGGGDYIFDVSNDGDRDVGFFDGGFSLSFENVFSCDLSATLLYYDENIESESPLSGVSVSSFFQGDYEDPEYVYRDSESDEPDEPLTPPDNPGLNGTGDSEGTGGIGGIDTNVPGASEGLSSVMSSLGSVITEFIPYIVYIGIGILSVIIGFVAIKRLINWIRRKTFGSFS